MFCTICDVIKVSNYYDRLAEPIIKVTTIHPAGSVHTQCTDIQYMCNREEFTTLIDREFKW